jgi:predicted secreted protein
VWRKRNGIDLLLVGVPASRSCAAISTLGNLHATSVSNDKHVLVGNVDRARA